ncbi:transposase [Streptomyces sp. NPDC016172]|uniref:transposase n=1 Tax=Streptomyces sp. NPDC016172 TaxID=3364964 RepID=UPI0036F4F2C1
MLDAVRYVVDNGVKWVNLPCDFPPYRRVHAFARRWQVTGLLAELHDRLRDKWSTAAPSIWPRSPTRPASPWRGRRRAGPGARCRAGRRNHCWISRTAAGHLGVWPATISTLERCAAPEV